MTAATACRGADGPTHACRRDDTASEPALLLSLRYATLSADLWCRTRQGVVTGERDCAVPAAAVLNMRDDHGLHGIGKRVYELALSRLRDVPLQLGVPRG